MPETVKRTFETEEFTNLHFVHPLSAGLVSRLAGTGITPDMVSLTGMLFGILSGIAYYHYQTPYMAVVGFTGMIIWHILDGADGQLARLTDNCSELGKILDGLCDYVTFFSVYVALGLMLSQQGGAAVWLIILSASLLHAIQSGAYELQRSEYDYWGHGKETAALPEIAQIITDLEGKSIAAFIFSQIHIGYIRMQRQTAGVNPQFRRELMDCLKNNPEKVSQIRALYRKTFAPTVRTWAIMSANYRTLAIFIASIAGQPIYFFWLEIVFLTPVLLFLLYKQRRLARLFSLHLKKISERHYPDHDNKIS